MSNIRERIEGLRRMYPRIGPNRYLYRDAAGLHKRGKRIVMHTFCVSDSGLATVHRTVFEKTFVMTVQQWSDWIEANAPTVLRNQVLAFLNRQFNDVWKIERVVGWHYEEGRRRARKRG